MRIATAGPRIAGVVLLALAGCGGEGGDGGEAVSSAGSNRAESPRWPTDPRVDAILEEVTDPGEPGVAVLVVQGGEVVHARGYGVADLETGRPFTPETPSRLGSLTKPFVAWAVMRLVEEGALSYDDPAATWLPELRRFDGVTVRHLLTHTSGIPDYYDFDALNEAAAGAAEASDAADGGRIFANEEAIAVYESEGEPVFEPGTEYRYSNPAYEALALIVERVSGVAFAEFMERELFEPLGMETAAIRELPSTVIPDRAIGYARDSIGGAWAEDDDHPLNWLIGAGGMYASLEDLRRFDEALGRWDEEGRMDEAFTPVVLPSGESTEYGLGWGIRDRPFGQLVGHTGAWVGFRTAYGHLRGEGFSILLLSNASLPVARLMERILSEVYFPPPEGS